MFCNSYIYINYGIRKMGEFSKFVGDYGEETVSNMLDLFGWTGHSSNISLPCSTKWHARNEHGIDMLFLYESPLESKTIENVIVSSKYSSNPYKNVKGTFKEHLKDIALTLECYSKSGLKKSSNDNISSTHSLKKIDTGVLFYINNDENPDNQNILQLIENVVIDPALKFRTVHVIDNNRAKFLYSAIKHIKNSYSESYFFYPPTSFNINGETKKYYGNILPVEYISSPIIPFYIDQGTDRETKICFACSFELTEESMETITSCIREIVADITKDLLLLFPNYNRIIHKDITEKLKMKIKQRDNVDVKIEVNSYIDTFRG